MTTKDVMDVTLKKERVCQRIIQDIKRRKRKPKHSFITTLDLADYMNVPVRIIHQLMDDALARKVRSKG